MGFSLGGSSRIDDVHAKGSAGDGSPSGMHRQQRQFHVPSDGLMAGQPKWVSLSRRN